MDEERERRTTSPEPGAARPPAERAAEAQPHFSEEQAVRFPLGVDCHDVGFRYLFDFTVVARALDLRPGARVLDFASGSSFISEFLNRFGYETVAVDSDPAILATGRSRLGLDRRCEPDRARFVAGDGQRLPFRDASFDGILCMNGLHHMEDYGATLAEMQRVLRPGARAAFSEPGSEHSRTPESVSMMRQFGVVEKDVVLERIYALARDAGFERLLLKPFVYPELVDLDFREFRRYRAGLPVSAERALPSGIAEVIERSHAIFCLVKEGEREPTSANSPPELLGARVELEPLPASHERGKPLPLAAVCRNAGRSTWIARRRAMGGHVSLGVRVLAEDGRLLEDRAGRHALPADVRPGESVRIEARLDLSHLPPGRYRLVVDMVSERVAWFQDLGSRAAERWIDLT